MKSLVINEYTLSCAAGVGLKAIRTSLANGVSGLSNTGWYDCDLPTWLGRVKQLDDQSFDLPPIWQSRNNRLAALAAHQDGFMNAVQRAINTFGPHRCGLVVGTSTSCIGRTEEGYRQLQGDNRFPPAYRQPEVHNPHATGAYLAQLFGVKGLAITVSTACSSSSKVFGVAARWLECGLADAVIVGGVDTLCQSVIYGFHSLQLVSEAPCRPFDRERNGISLGEAAGMALLSREPLYGSELRLLGFGESSDAYHMSSAHPEGLGAELAMRQAVERASLQLKDIGYINLHGTGTRANDSIEGRVCKKLFNDIVPCSSTKGWTGHTLGAAGICEAVITLEALRFGLLPGTMNTQVPEAELADSLILTNMRSNIRIAMSNSFGFGGNNCSLVFGAA